MSHCMLQDPNETGNSAAHKNVTQMSYNNNKEATQQISTTEGQKERVQTKETKEKPILRKLFSDLHTHICRKSETVSLHHKLTTFGLC